MFPRWFQLKCSSLAAVALCATNAMAAVANKPLPKLLTEVEAKYSKAATLSADFVQINQDVLLSKKKVSSGKIYVKRPSKFRWETTLPDENLFITDGSRFWFYTPPFDKDERGQVIEKKTSDVQSKLANALLSGSFSVARDMTIAQKTPSTFELKPKNGTAGTVSQALVEIDPETKLIQKVTLNHRGGNRSEIFLKNIALGPILTDSLFVFKAPPNTDVVDDFAK